MRLINLSHSLLALVVIALSASANAQVTQSQPQPNNPVQAAAPAQPQAATGMPQDPFAGQNLPKPDITGSVQAVQTIPAEQAQPAPPAAAVVAQPTALAAADYLDIKVQPGDGKYNTKQYTINLQNKQPRHIELMQVEVVNGMSEEAYHLMVQERSQSKRRVAGGLLRGVTGIATSFVPYAGIGSYAAYQGIHAGSQAAYLAANAVENAPSGGGNYANRVLQRANNIMLSPSQNFQCLAVVPENQQPIVRLIFKDLQTNQIFDLQK